MNVKEAIERGLYPKDEKGRALVPTRGGRTLTVYATDHHVDWPIVCKLAEAEVSIWRADGQFYGTHTGDRDLMPPPPRKVTVEIAKDFGGHWYIADIRGDNHTPLPFGTHLALTTEIEEPWS